MDRWPPQSGDPCPMHGCGRPVGCLRQGILIATPDRRDGIGADLWGCGVPYHEVVLGYNRPALLEALQRPRPVEGPCAIPEHLLRDGEWVHRGGDYGNVWSPASACPRNHTGAKEARA